MIEPFDNSSNLATWAANVLADAGIDELPKWRMLEYWMQVELFKAIESSKTLNHAGFYEQPYYTKYPRPTSKTNYKWIDLLVRGERELCWIELKDLGRSSSRVKENSKGLGLDLSALVGLEIENTITGLLSPPSHIVDKARLDEWATLAGDVKISKHYISQIVMLSKSVSNAEPVIEWWSDSFSRRSGATRIPEFSCAETKEFWIIGTIDNLLYANAIS